MKNNTTIPLVCLGNKNGNQMRPLAVRSIIENLRYDIDLIIFSWGKTSGRNLPSEAEEMRNIFIGGDGKDILESFYSFPRNGSIELEENSFDTEQNARETRKLLNILGYTRRTVYLVTSELMILRAVDTFIREWFDPIPLVAEKILYEESSISHQEIRKLQKQEAWMIQPYIEPFARVLTRLALARKIISSFTKKRIER